MPDLKMGKRPAVRPYGLMQLADYAIGKLPTPPARSDPPAIDGDWGMDGNDAYGDCVIAGIDHGIAAWNATVGQHDSRPDNSQIVDTYLRLTGGVDSGLVEHDTLQTWQKDGLFGGNRIAAYAPVNHDSPPAIMQAIAFYGICYLGVALPQSAMDQYGADQQWTPVPGSPIIGGHCVILVGYDPGTTYAVTWGKVIPVAWTFLAAYLDEAWAIIPQAYVEAGHGPNIDLDALKADIASLRA